MTDFFAIRIPPFPFQLPSPTESFHALTHGLSSCIRRMVRQLSVKVSPLLLHPNLGISQSAQVLLVTMNKVWD